MPFRSEKFSRQSLDREVVLEYFAEAICKLVMRNSIASDMPFRSEKFSRQSLDERVVPERFAEAS